MASFSSHKDLCTNCTNSLSPFFNADERDRTGDSDAESIWISEKMDLNKQNTSN